MIGVDPLRAQLAKLPSLHRQVLFCSGASGVSNFHLYVSSRCSFKGPHTNYSPDGSYGRTSRASGPPMLSFSEAVCTECQKPTAQRKIWTYKSRSADVAGSLAMCVRSRAQRALGSHAEAPE